MKTKNLVLCCFSTALLGSPVLAADSSSAPTPMASVSKVVKIAGMDKAPVVIKKVIPAYPRELREHGIQGTATVDMLIDSTGRVVSTELVSTTVPEFGQLALKAAKDWTFVPASAQGKPISTRVRVPFEFVMPQLVAMERR
jgi:TonB family protein